jgi:hypothetical protein
VTRRALVALAIVATMLLPFHAADARSRIKTRPVIPPCTVLHAATWFPCRSAKDWCLWYTDPAFGLACSDERPFTPPSLPGQAPDWRFV